MKIKLCYKEYPIKMSLGACKAFSDKTGLDLQTVLMEYIAKCSDNSDKTLMGRMVSFAKIYNRSVACDAIHALINGGGAGVSLDEIQDATYRVGWAVSERDDDISEPWPMVMLDAALQVNDYFVKNTSQKKTGISVE